MQTTIVETKSLIHSTPARREEEHPYTHLDEREASLMPNTQDTLTLQTNLAVQFTMGNMYN
jgi:hypothetical protein